MNNDYSHLSKEEQLKAENEFLKMKLMLEQGARFESSKDAPELDPLIENQFLKNIAAIEQQFQERKRIKLFDMIRRPGPFKPVSDIPDSEIENAWNELDSCLADHQINLDVMSPNVTTRELYRFTTEELFDYEMDDIQVPGMINHFIYDEFHPDLKFESTCIARNKVIEMIFDKEPVDFLVAFRDKDLRLNQRFPLTRNELRELINRFKEKFETIELCSVKDHACLLDQQACTVTGEYCARVSYQGKENILAGNWEVQFEIEDNYYLGIIGLKMEIIS